MLCGALAWCYLEKGNVVPHPPKNPPADRLLNWMGQFDVQGRTQTGHMEQGCVSPFTQSITVTAGCNQEGSVAFPEAAHGSLIIALDTGSAGVRTGDSSDLASQCLPTSESQSRPCVTKWVISHICQKASLVLSSTFASLVCQFDV